MDKKIIKQRSLGYAHHGMYGIVDVIESTWNDNTVTYSGCYNSLRYDTSDIMSYTSGILEFGNKLPHWINFSD